MIDFFAKKDEFNVIDVLKKDHDKVKDLFDQFDKSISRREKRKIVSEVIMEIKLHTTVEEEIFYPAVRKPIGKKVMNEADEEHHIAKVIISELEQMSDLEDHYDAKFTVLAENVRHHIKEEENEIFPQARDLKLDMGALGRQVMERKVQLKKAGIALFSEEKKVIVFKGRNDSQVRPAKKVNFKTSPGKAVKRKTSSIINNSLPKKSTIPANKMKKTNSIKKKSTK